MYLHVSYALLMHLIVKCFWLLKKRRKSSRFHTCSFEKKTHSTRSSWEMPKDNYDSRETSDVSRSRRLLRIPFESKGGLCCINSFGIRPCHQVSTGSIDPWHHSIRKVSLGLIPKCDNSLQNNHSFMGRTIDPKALRFLVVQNN